MSGSFNQLRPFVKRTGVSGILKNHDHEIAVTVSVTGIAFSSTAYNSLPEPGKVELLASETQWGISPSDVNAYVVAAPVNKDRGWSRAHISCRAFVKSVGLRPGLYVGYMSTYNGRKILLFPPEPSEPTETPKSTKRRLKAPHE